MKKATEVALSYLECFYYKMFIISVAFCTIKVVILGFL